MSYSYYLKVKDKCCIHYDGHNTEYILQLRMTKDDLQAYYEDIEFTYAFRPEYTQYFEGSVGTYERDKFAFCLPLIYDAKTKKHPVVKLLDGVYVKKFKSTGSKSHTAYVTTVADFPNKSLTDEEIRKGVSFCRNKGFKVDVIDQKLGATETRRIAGSAAYIVGAANELLYEAVAAGTPTALIPTDSQAEEAYRLFAGLPNVLP